MGESETFGIEKGNGEKVIQWINSEAKKQNWKFEDRLYGYEIKTRNFGDFEMFSWIGDTKAARNLVAKASKRFKIRVIEGGFKIKERTLGTKKTDYAMVRKGGKMLGHLQFSASRLGNEKWKLEAEERK